MMDGEDGASLEGGSYEIVRRRLLEGATQLEAGLDALDAARRATFGTTVQDAETTKVLAANQGLYNGFLSVGLVVGLLADDETLLFTMLGCVVAAGLYGAATVSRRIAVVQALPAALAIAALLAAR